jgi:hypothetical protein
MTEELLSYIPLSAEIPEGLWPEDLLNSEGGSFLDHIAYEDGELVGTPDSWALLAQLRAVDEIAFEFPLLQGTAIVLGSGPVEISAEGSSHTWNVEVSAEVLKLRFSRTILKPVTEQNGRFIADPDEDHFVEVALPLTLVGSSSGNVDIIWPGEEATPLALPK